MFYLKKYLKVENEKFSFNFIETEDNLLKSICVKLDKYEVKRIKKNDFN